ncbi:MAG: thioether cross-link-forming SCIFF peptide maturase [Clostridia bacterium]|nr:thioether cross-link-forming SCIFF peptide maturase [Clostridia bacterium]
MLRIMVHVFSFKEYNYIFDSGSGSLHECDKATADYLRAMLGEDVDTSYLSAKERAAIDADIEALKAEGLLFKEETKERPMKSSEVKALCLHICHDCNLRCRYCFADSGAYYTKREFMSEETAKRAIDFLLEGSGNRKILEVDFFGGEPLMNIGTIKKVVAYAREKEKETGKKFLFTTTTNALLLTSDVIKFFNEEMENVVVSLDGRPDVHDAVRKSVSGKGSYDLVIDNAKKFARARGDKKYYVRGTFTAKNLDFSEDVIYLAEQGFDSISMEPVVTDIEDLAIKEEHLPVILKEYEKLAERYLDKWEKGEGFNFFHFNIDLEGGPCLPKRVSACGAGNEYFSVVPSGDIYPCHQFAQEEPFYMGNVFKGKLDEKIRKTFAENSLFTRRGCDACFAKYICSGGCNANNFHFCGDINEPYGITCAMMKKRVECAMHILARKKAAAEK